MHKTIITAAVCALALLSSCASLQTRTGHTKEVQGAIVHQPVLADLNVRNTKVTGTATASTGNSLDAVKNLALKEALTSAKADLLVEPTYEQYNRDHDRFPGNVHGLPHGDDAGHRTDGRR